MTISPHLPSIDRALFRGMTISHYSYAVEDIAEAVLHWTTLLGAGPFFIMDPVVLDRVTTRDEQEAEWAHSAAFGKWGPIFVELQQLRGARPHGLAELLSPAGLPVVNHVSYVSATPEADSARFSAAGHEMIIHATSGPLEFWLHDTRAALGHVTEIHRGSTELTAIWDFVASAADAWDGSQPLRAIPSPGE
jgi:methylmalonyl-CoA/ethylmalonyl-CoA epimerase